MQWIKPGLGIPVLFIEEGLHGYEGFWQALHSQYH